MTDVAIQSGQFAQVGGGIRLHYASAGRRGAPLMLFVHGFPQAWFEWEEQLAHFGGSFFAVACDLRGFGQSSKPKAVAAYRASHIVGDLQALVHALGYEEAIVVAHDWGGAIAWNFAIFHPETVKRLIILNAPHPWIFYRELIHSEAQRASSEYMNWLCREGAEAALEADDFARLEGFFNDAANEVPAWFDAATRARYHALWSIPGEDGSSGLTGGLNYYRASPMKPGMAADTPGFADQAAWMVRVPTRVLWGETDRALLPGLLDGLEALVPDLRITRLPRGSHWLAQEDPAEVSRLIQRSLTD